MADEKHEASGWVGPFHLGASHDEVGPGLGRLYEAWHADGCPALLLMPGSAMDWRPEGPWRVQLSFEPARNAVVLKVEQSPSPPELSELANVLVLTTETVKRVEDDPQIRTHLATHEEPTQTSERRLRGAHSFPWGGALAGLAMLALGAGVWWSLAYPHTSPPAASSQDSGRRSLERAAYLINAEEPSALSSGYPLPAKPFQNQAIAPCNAKRGEVSINDGCWVSLEQKPPCLDDHAEYQGKCYLPVARKDRPPQSAQP